MSDSPRPPMSGPRAPTSPPPVAPRNPPPSRRRGKAAGRLRPVGFDDLGLKRALSDRLLPFLVAAMAFLAALALAGALATAMLAQHWQQGAEAELTIQVPTPDDPAASGHGARLAAVMAILRAEPGVLAAKPMSSDDLAKLLKPWLGDAGTTLALPLPAVIAVTLTPGSVLPDDLSAKLAAAAPDTATESADVWAARLSALARSLQACAAVMLLLVVGVAIAVVTVATRAGLSARRDAIEIVHGLGATDAYIAGRFARRAMRLAAAGGVGGALAALPVLLWLAYLAAPFAQGNAAVTDQTPLIALPLPLWIALPALPLAAAAIGYVTAEGTVRRWLRRLP
ncbi:cell division protein FtsX [Acidisoma cellulosilyticum]|uniref:cell division protein FtsX n=1 Tax=Acidisoma cellulosilyticum TaxID=2802395 RepID=UPI001D0B591F|nr:cell division protein FtsX [Acidisoma cellulosilyticum]